MGFALSLPLADHRRQIDGLIGAPREDRSMADLRCCGPNWRAEGLIKFGMKTPRPVANDAELGPALLSR